MNSPDTFEERRLDVIDLGLCNAYQGYQGLFEGNFGAANFWPAVRLKPLKQALMRTVLLLQKLSVAYNLLSNI